MRVNASGCLVSHLLEIKWEKTRIRDADVFDWPQP